jgi:hypothetical protein
MATPGMPSDTASSLLRRWAKLGTMVTAARLAHRRDWAPAQRMIEAARERLLWESERLRDLLQQSNAALAPLEDPLLTDFGTHRWLSEAREEVYSDWLMWIAQQLQTPERVFRLFGIAVPCDVTTPLTVQRELPVPRGHDNQSGRLDFVARYAGQAIIVVEVKKGGADAADTDKQRGYMEWLKRQPEPREHKHAILLVTAADCEDYHCFRPFLWSSLCIKLRQMVPELCKDRRSVVAAMILAFVGAVEQNLLRFSAQPVQFIYKGQNLILSSEIGTHIKKSFEGLA